MYSKDNIFKRMAEERGITEEEMREEVYRTGGQFCRSYGSAGWLTYTYDEIAKENEETA